VYKLILFTCTVTEIIVSPINKTVMVGDNTRLECSTDHQDIPVIWNIYAQDNKKTAIYRLGEIHQKFRQRFEVSSAVEGHYDLVITNIQLADEGFYECEDEAGLGESEQAYLSVRPEITSEQTSGNHVVFTSLKRCLNRKCKTSI